MERSFKLGKTYTSLTAMMWDIASPRFAARFQLGIDRKRIREARALRKQQKREAKR